MEQITLKAPAKINLSLAITGRRQDGYHLLRSVMQTVSLYDTVSVSKAESAEILIECNIPEIPCDSSNIAYKAATAFFSSTKLPMGGLRIRLEKQIPSQAGLGGGSADGAAVIVALDRLFDTRLSLEQLCQIGLSVGADVPFCIMGGTALAEGIGEILTPAPSLPDCHIVLCKPPIGISTADAYRKYDQGDWHYDDHTDSLLDALRSRDLHRAAGYLFNLFEQLVPLPEVVAIQSLLKEHGALQSVMSGSGSAVYGIFDSEEKAKQAAESCRERYGDVFLCTPTAEGITEA